MAALDAHAKPPEKLRDIYKAYQKASKQDLLDDPSVIDLQRDSSLTQLEQVSSVSIIELMTLFSLPIVDHTFQSDMPLYASRELPGLQIIPGLLDGNAQRALLDRLLHRDLSNSEHKTNVSLHYHIPYESSPLSRGRAVAGNVMADQQTKSFFSRPLNSTADLQPLNAGIHKPISMFQFLNKKLRWMTLGGQYDWTEKTYPDGRQPSFPADISRAIQTVFPQMKPEAAICNLYTPGDTLSLHRDVSESADRGLVSISMGCDAIFIIASQPERPVILRLHGGDAVFMSEEARYAWHGVPQVLRGTCPEDVADWPAGLASQLDRQIDIVNRSETDEYEHWRGWLKNKRINLNIRQMFEE